MTILIHSAAGGAGSALVQLAKIAECRVIGVVGSSHKVEHVKELGCDVVIDKSREPLWPAVDRARRKGSISPATPTAPPPSPRATATSAPPAA